MNRTITFILVLMLSAPAFAQNSYSSDESSSRFWEQIERIQSDHQRKLDRIDAEYKHKELLDMQRKQLQELERINKRPSGLDRYSNDLYRLR